MKVLCGSAVWSTTQLLSGPWSGEWWLCETVVLVRESGNCVQTDIDALAAMLAGMQEGGRRKGRVGFAGQACSSCTTCMGARG